MARLPQQHARGAGPVHAPPPPARAGPRPGLQIPAAASVSSSSPAFGAAPPFAPGGPCVGSQPLPPPGACGQKGADDSQQQPALEMRRLPALKVGVPGRGHGLASSMSTGSSCSPASPASISTAPGTTRPLAAGARAPPLLPPASPDAGEAGPHTPRWGSFGPSMSFSSEDHAEGGTTDPDFQDPSGRSPGAPLGPGAGTGYTQHPLRPLQSPSGPSPSSSWASEWTGERSCGRKEERGEGQGEGGGEEGGEPGMEPHQGGNPHCSPLHSMGAGDEEGSMGGDGQFAGIPSMDLAECGGEGASPRGVRPRFTQEQCQALEKSFCENRNLDSSRRASLAAQLGVQPRQVAIWFQNRRARLRYKMAGQQVQSMSSKYSEMTERCAKLEQRYECLKQDHKRVLEQNANLRCQISELTTALSKLAAGACDTAAARRSTKRIRQGASSGAGASPGGAAAPATSGPTGGAPGSPGGSNTGQATSSSPVAPMPGSPLRGPSAMSMPGGGDTCDSSSNCAPLPRKVKAVGKAPVGSPGVPRRSTVGTSSEDLSAPNTPAKAPSSRLDCQTPPMARGTHTTQGSNACAPPGGPGAPGDSERHTTGTPLGAPSAVGAKRKALPSSLPSGSGPLGLSAPGNPRPPLCVPVGSPRPAANLLSVPSFARASAGPGSAYAPPARPGCDAASPLPLPTSAPSPAPPSGSSPFPTAVAPNTPCTPLPQHPQQQQLLLPMLCSEASPPSTPTSWLALPQGTAQGVAAPSPPPPQAEPQVGAQGTPPAHTPAQGTFVRSTPGGGVKPKTEFLLPEAGDSSSPKETPSSGAPMEGGASNAGGAPDSARSGAGLAALEGELQLDDMLTHWDAAFGMPGSAAGSPSRTGSPGPGSGPLAHVPFLPFLDLRATEHALGFAEGPLGSPSGAGADLGERSLSAGSSADGSSADPLSLAASPQCHEADPLALAASPQCHEADPLALTAGPHGEALHGAALAEDGGLGMQHFWWDMN